ncbi:MAG: hypothetical protein ACI86C_001043 [Candidatus Latescibacterota bacterium]|jgi:hypothetical protein
MKIKSFAGTSKNAVKTKVWVAMCIYLPISSLKFRSSLTKKMQKLLRLLQLNLYGKRDLMALIKGVTSCES